jgi:hypothetical protein
LAARPFSAAAKSDKKRRRRRRSTALHIFFDRARLAAVLYTRRTLSGALFFAGALILSAPVTAAGFL